MHTYPLLDIQAAFDDCKHNLRVLAYGLAALLTYPECQSPPTEAVQVALANVMAVREMLADDVFPPAFVEALAEEQAQMEEDDTYWSRD